MNEQDIIALFDDPSAIHRFSYHELKSLVKEYPYCQPLRILLAMKSEQTESDYLPKDLAAAAAASYDRAWLYKLWETVLPQLQEEQHELEDQLELVDLSVWRPDKQQHIVPITMETEKKKQQVLQNDQPGQVNIDQPEQKEVEADKPSPVVEAEAERIHEQDVPNAHKEPLPKSAFSSWLQEFDAPRPQGRYFAASSANENTISDQSLRENTEIASETLAKLLESQGQYTKAIEVYRRLMLIMPEKNTYFARQIQKLENKT